MKIAILEGKYKDLHQVMQKSKKDYFEFDLPFIDENEVFRELDRFLYESRTQKTHFKNQYTGKVYINVSEWNDYQNKYLDAFLYFLYDNVEEQILDVTLINEEITSEKLLERVSKIFDVKRTSLKNMEREENKRVIGFISGSRYETGQKGEEDEYICK